MNFLKSFCKSLVVEFLEGCTYNMSVTNLPLGISGCHYELVTMGSDYNPIATELFRWFRNVISICNSQNVEELLPEMLKVYRQFKTDLSIPLREHILTEGIIEVCYQTKISNSFLISEVLNLVYECWTSFGSLHYKAILRSKHRYQLTEESKRRNEKLGFLPFFLEHSRRSKLQFNGVRMIDVSIYNSLIKAPVFVAAEIWRWKALLTYLQFGARIEDVLVDPIITRSDDHHLALYYILRNLVHHLWVKLVQPAIMLRNRHEINEYCQNLAPGAKDLCKTITIILRAVRRLRHGSLDFTIREQNGEWQVEVSSRRVLYHQTVAIMLPYLSKRYSRPDELQHGCRWVIRNRLNENWQLPNGIRSLPVPSKIKRYLNLLSG